MHITCARIRSYTRQQNVECMQTDSRVEVRLKNMYSISHVIDINPYSYIILIVHAIRISFFSNILRNCLNDTLLFSNQANTLRKVDFLQWMVQLKIVMILKIYNLC